MLLLRRLALGATGFVLVAAVGVPRGSAAPAQGSVAGLYQWCIPALATTSTTTSPATGASTTSPSVTTPSTAYRVLSGLAPTFVDLRQGTSVVARTSALTTTFLHRWKHDPNNVGPLVMSVRFVLHAPPGRYQLVNAFSPVVVVTVRAGVVTNVGRTFHC